MYIEPDVDYEVLKAANERHDRQPHSICMWPRANYRGPVQPPPDDERPPRPRVIRTMDAFGNIHEEVRVPAKAKEGR